MERRTEADAGRMRLTAMELAGEERGHPLAEGGP